MQKENPTIAEVGDQDDVTLTGREFLSLARSQTERRSNTGGGRENGPSVTRDGLSATDLTGAIALSIASHRKDLRNRLRLLLTNEPDIEVVGECIDSPEVVPVWLKKLQPKLLLLDITLSSQPLSKWLRIIGEEDPTIKVILLCDRTPTNYVEEITKYAVCGCLLVRDQPETYVNAIRAVSKDDIWLPRRLLVQAFTNRVPRPDRGGAATALESPDKARASTLTDREKTVAEFVAHGLTNKQIARQLLISEDTVKKHLKNIFHKLGVRRRSQLAALYAAQRPTDPHES